MERTYQMIVVALGLSTFFDIKVSYPIYAPCMECSPRFAEKKSGRCREIYGNIAYIAFGTICDHQWLNLLRQGYCGLGILFSNFPKNSHDLKITQDDGQHQCTRRSIHGKNTTSTVCTPFSMVFLTPTNCK